MSDYTIETVKADIGALGKNVIKIRKYIRDHQSQLQQFSTNMLNQAVRGAIPAGMLLKRNYGVLSLRSAGAPEAIKPKQEKQEEEVYVKAKTKKQVVEAPEDESDDDEADEEPVVRRPVRRSQQMADVYQEEPQYEYVQREIPHYMMSNEDLAKMSFIEAAQRKWRRFT